MRGYTLEDPTDPQLRWTVAMPGCTRCAEPGGSGRRTSPIDVALGHRTGATLECRRSATRPSADEAMSSATGSAGGYDDGETPEGTEVGT